MAVSDRGILVGHSMGGAIAMDVAVKRPDLIRSLVLEEAAGNGGQSTAPPPEFRSVFFGAIDDIMQGDTRSGVGAFMDFVSGPGYFDSLSVAEQQFLIQNAATISIGQMPPIVLCSDAMTISVPILFIGGELSPLRESAVAGCLPPHTQIVIDDASHGVHNDNPVDYNASLRQFIGQL